MQDKHKPYRDFILAFSMMLLAPIACKTISSRAPSQLPPITQVVAVTQIVPVTQINPVTQIMPGTVVAPLTPQVRLQRLSVSFLGQDGHSIIGSGCPGSDGKGTIVDYHLMVSNVEENRKVERIIVTGDNSTLTWESPCSNAWALSAKDLGTGNWEIFIAPSLPSRVYTVMVFYEDNSFALGMVITP
jgi:hypothetical protein